MKKDKVNDPNKPKRPPSCFFLFKEEFKKTYKEKHPYPSLKLHNSPVCRVSIDAGEKWKRMLNAEKAPYIAKAKEMMAEYKQKMQAYNGGAPEIDEEEEEEEEETLPLSPTTNQAACASSETTDHDDLGELVADRFLKFRDAIIKDYLASKTFDKELDEHLDKYKGSEEHRKELAHHLERFKKSQDFHKVLAFRRKLLLLLHRAVVVLLMRLNSCCFFFPSSSLCFSAQLIKKMTWILSVSGS